MSSGFIAIQVRTTLVLLATVVAFSTAHSAEPSTNKPAVVKVSGFGILGNREMVRLLRNFQLSGRFPVIIDRTFVEDTALVLLSRVNEDGYLQAKLQANLETPNGLTQKFVWTNGLDVALPRDFSARKASFKVKSGVRFYYKTIEFDGLSVFSESEAKSYFVSSDTLLRLHRNRVFSPSALRNSIAALQQAYARAGYQNATVTTNKITQNNSTGEVTVQIGIQEGLPSIVRSVRVEVLQEGEETVHTLKPKKPYSHLWQQTLAQQLQTEQFTNGYPDATVTFYVLDRDTNAVNIQVDLRAQVDPGPLVRVHDVDLRGNERTRTSVLRRRISLKPGELLDRVQAEKIRQNLARLSAFESVRLNYEDVTNEEWNVIYDFQEAKPTSLNLLLGYGSYELLRGGFEFQNRNVFGLSHNLRLRAH